EGRNWAERAGDEAKSWVGDRDAERRREEDRQTIGRYPGEDRGERRYGEDRDDGRFGNFGGRSGYDRRYASGDRDGYRGDSETAGAYGVGRSYGARNWRDDDEGRGGFERGNRSGDRSSRSSYGEAQSYGSSYSGGEQGRYGGAMASGSNYGQGHYGDLRASESDRHARYGGQGGYSGQGAFGDRGRHDQSHTAGDQGRFGATGPAGQPERHGGGYTPAGPSAYGENSRLTPGTSGYGSYSTGSGNERARSSQGDWGSRPGQSGYGSYRAERSGSYGSASGPSDNRTDPGAFSQSPTGGAYGATGFQAAREAASYGDDWRERNERWDRETPRGTFAGESQDYHGEDRGFFSKAADEVRSWFGDEDAERRRQLDQQREDAEQAYRGAGEGGSGSSHNQWDPHYHEYRSQRAAELDREYDEYRSSGFQSGQDFASWRSSRQSGGAAAASGAATAGLASAGASGNSFASQVKEHARVVGSDGQTVGTVDHVHGSDIKLAKNDSPDGKHHLIPLSWVERVEGNEVRLSKKADEAKREWRDADNQGQLGQLNDGLIGSTPKQDTTQSAASGASSTVGSGNSSAAGATTGSGHGTLGGGHQAGSTSPGAGAGSTSSAGSAGARL
ncbi:MAG: DUF2171 domain-containing protein, partial [Sphingomonadaceae bacterium]|nr:DUF2171 domain-containing protein [Sphingomonadaceae bacterium]